MRRLGMADFLGGRLGRGVAAASPAAYQIAVAARRPQVAGLVAAEPGLGDHHPRRLRRRRRGARPRRPALRRAQGPGRPGLAARHHRVRPAARRPARPRRSGWPGSSCRSASGSARPGRSARCARSRRSPPPSWASWPRPTARRAGPTATSPPPTTTGGAASRWWPAGWSRAGWASTATPRTCSPRRWPRARRSAHPLLIGMAGTVRGFVALDRGDSEAAELDARSVLTMVVAARRARPGPGRPAGAAGRRPAGRRRRRDGGAAARAGRRRPVRAVDALLPTPGGRRLRGGAAGAGPAGGGAGRRRAGRAAAGRGHPQPGALRRWRWPGALARGRSSRSAEAGRRRRAQQRASVPPHCDISRSAKRRALLPSSA